MQPRRYQFGEFLLDCKARKLLRSSGETVPLTPKEFHTLVVLVESSGRALERQEMMSAIWPDTTVGDTSLARNISVLRRTLGADSIESVARFGYRFVPTVVKMTAEEPEDIAPLSAEPSLTAEAPFHAEFAADEGRFLSVRWISAMSVVAVGILLAVALPRWRVHAGIKRSEHTPAIEGPIAIAVLPFRNLSVRPTETDYRRDGLAEDLIARLGELDDAHLRVLASTTTRQYTGTSKSINQIGSETGARYLLEGTVDYLGDDARLHANLVDTHDQTVLWSESFEGPQDDLEAEESVIVQRVATIPAFSLKAATLASGNGAGPTQAAARDEYLRGRSELARNNRDGYKAALDHFQRAFELDDKYARALAGVSEAYIYRTDTLPLSFCYAKSREAALTAIRLDPNLGEAHRDLAYLEFSEHNDMQTAELEFKTALKLIPQDPKTHLWFAYQLSGQRRSSEAIQQVETAYQLDPRSSRMLAHFGFLLAQNGQVQRGLTMLHQSLQMEPQSEMTWGFLGIAYLDAHQYPEAAAAFDHAAAFESFSASYLADAAYARAKAGDLSDARRLEISFQGHLARHEWVPGQAMAMDQIALGDRTKAAAWVRKGLKDNSIALFELNNEPFYSEIKGDPHFSTLLAVTGKNL